MSRHEKSTHTATDPTASPPRLPATLRLGAVHLIVSDLDRSVAFYEDALGLRLHRREGGVAAMGVGEEDLLVLYGEPKARRAPRGPLPLRAAVSLPRGVGARGAASCGDKDPDPRRL